MSFLTELQDKKKKLKSCETVVTSIAGSKILERKNCRGETEVRNLMETCPGFVVDEKLDLQVAQILDYLYLSSQDVAQDLALLEQHGITHVLSIGVELPTPDPSCKIKFKKIELFDEPTADLVKILNACFDFIEGSKMENENNKILVHCNAGYSRAPAVVIGYLMKKFGYSLAESYDIVKEKRNVKPNSGFMGQLQKLEMSLKLSGEPSEANANYKEFILNSQK